MEPNRYPNDPIETPEPVEERGRKMIRDYTEKPASSWGLMPLLLGIALIILVGYLLFGGDQQQPERSSMQQAEPRAPY